MTEDMKADKKEVIRKAAVDVISEYGYYNTSISQIAERAAVAVGTIYNYFENKEEILEYIFSVELEKRIKFLKELKEKEISVWDKIKKFLEMHFAEVRRNTAAAKISVREKEFPRAAHSGAIAEYRSQIPEQIKKIVQEAVAKGEMREHNIEIISAMIFASVHGIVERAIKTDNFAVLQEAPEEVIDLLKNGLK